MITNPHRLLAILLFCLPLSIQAQKDIKNVWELMERQDLNIRDVDAWADAYFAVKGKEQGSGYKQFQRWRYERQFHLDKNGYFIQPEAEFQAYTDAFPVGKSQARNLGGAWTEVGPYAKNATSSWSPGQGRLTGIAIHPNTESTIYVSSPGGGLWKSTNSGSAWTPLIDNVNSSWMDIYHVAIAASSESTLYAGRSSGGVLKSTNSGATWSATGSGPSSIRKILIHPVNADTVLAAANNGVWRSVNGGTSWTRTLSTSNIQDIEFKADNVQIVLATGYSSSIWRSTTNGGTWTQLALPAGSTTGRTMVGVTPANSDVIYVVQAEGSLFGRLHKSVDAGLTYTTLIVGNTTGNNYFGYNTNGVDTRGQATYDMAIAVNPTNADEVHIAGIICWKSTDGGNTFAATTQWTWPATGNYNHADVHQLEWVGANLYAASDGGIYKSTNNATSWTDLTTNIGIRQFYRIGTSKTTANIITGGLQDNGSSYRQNGTTWVDWLGADGMDCVIDPNNSSKVLGTSQLGNIYRTTNAGASRSNLSRPNEGNWVTPLAGHPTHSDTLYGGWQGFYRSANAGSTWTLLGATQNAMNCIAVAPSNTQYLYASNSSFFFCSKDGGATWTTPAAPSNNPSGITSIAVSPLNPEKIWVTTSASSSNVWRSDNAGTSWTSISAGLPSVAARSIVVADNAAEDLYVGMNIGVYTRSNVNTNWVEQATGLPLVAVNEVEIQKVSGKLFVATYGRGIWESDLSNTVLPVELTSFTGKANGNVNDVAWSVAAQIGIKHYTIERSEDGLQDWQTIGQVEPQKNQTADYNHTDKQPLPISYYRLKVLEEDSQFYYSKVIAIDRQKIKFGIRQLFPNPVERRLQIEFDAERNGKISVVVRDVLGRDLLSQNVDSQEGRNNLTLDVGQLPSATYFLFVADGKQQIMEKFVKK